MAEPEEAGETTLQSLLTSRSLTTKALRGEHVGTIVYADSDNGA